MASSPYEKLLDLAHQRALNGKGGLAASVAEMCLASKAELTERELSLAFEILRLLLDKVDVKIRRHIADYLADRPDVPEDLVRFLANDDITVAYPMILHSNRLSEPDLLDIAAERTMRHRQAIAIRPNISEQVTDRIVDFNEVEVLTTLLCNETAEISEAAMQKLVERSLDIESYREPLAHRKEMTRALARRLYAWVGEVLRHYIVHQYGVNPDTDAEPQVVGDNRRSRESSMPRSRGMAGRSRSGGADNALDPAEEFAAGRSLLRYLNRGDISGFEGAFATQLNLPLQAMGMILYDSDLSTLAIACKAAGIESDVFGDILCHLSGVRPIEDFRSSQEYDRAMEYFERIDHTGASEMLNKWRQTPDEVWRA